MAKRKRSSPVLEFGIRGDNLNAALSNGNVQIDDGHVRWADLRQAIAAALRQHPEAEAALVLAIESNFGIAPGTKISL